jgi:replicative DNA helicase
MARDQRVLPHNDDAEASIRGGVRLRNEVLTQLDTLEVEDVYTPRHKIVFAAIRALEAAAKPIDVVTLENEIEKQGKLDAIGGVAFLGELALRVPTADTAVEVVEPEEYESFLQERRTEIQEARSAVQEAVEDGTAPGVELEEIAP